MVQPLVLLGIAEMKDSPDDLPSTRRIGPAVAMPLEHDRRPVVGLDHGPEVGPKWPRRALPTGKVRTAKPTSHRAFASSLGQIQVLLPAALEPDLPTLGIRKADPVQRF